MADIQSNIRVNIDTAEALASIKALQKQISTFQKEMAASSTANALAAKNLQKSLIDDINATGKFSASIKTINSTTDTFTRSLEKNKLSLGEYFRYGMASSKSFSRMFQSEFDTVNKVARERVKDLQTQYVSLGRDASGALKAIAIRPLALDMQDMGTKAQIAAQRTQIFNQVLKQGSTNLLNFGKNTQWAGRQLMVGFTVPLSIFGSAAAQEFKKIEEASIKFKRVYGDAFTPSEQTNAMLEQIKKVGLELTKYGVSLEQTLGLAADAAAMGQTGQQLLAQVEQSTKLSVLGQTAAQDALNTTISLTSAFGYSTTQLAEKTNFLNAVENQTVLSIQDLTEAIPKAGPVIKQLGGDVEDLSFFMTAMKEGGINASEGANALKSGLASLINPTEKARTMLLGLGIDMKQILQDNEGNVSGVVVDFAKALDKLDPTTRAQAIEQLFGKFQFARLSSLFQNVIAEGSQAQRVLELTSMTASDLAALSAKELGTVEQSSLYKFQAALEKFQASMAPVGEQFMKMVTPFIEFGTKILDMFNNMTDGAKGFITTIVGLAGVVAPVFIMAFGLISNALANGMKGFLFLKNALQGTLKETSDLGEQTQYMTQEQLQASAVAASLDQVHGKLTQTFTSEAAAIDRLRDAMEKAATAQARFGSVNVAGGAKGPKPKNYAKGGIVVSGPGGPTGDKIPANLSDGEVVLSAATVDENPGIVAALLGGGKVKIPGFAGGSGEGSVSFNGTNKQYNFKPTKGPSNQTTTDAIQTILDRIKSGEIEIERAEDVVARAFEILDSRAEEVGITLKDFAKAITTSSEEITGQSTVNQLKKKSGLPYDIVRQSSPSTKSVKTEMSEAGRSAEYDRAAIRAAAEGEVTRQLKLGGFQADRNNPNQTQIDRAHRVQVSGAQKQFDMAWVEDTYNPQSHSENALSETLSGGKSDPNRSTERAKFYDAYMVELEKQRAEEKMTNEEYLSIKEKVNNNLALTEVELGKQADILEQLVIADEKKLQEEQMMPKESALGGNVRRAVAGARAVGGLSDDKNVGVAKNPAQIQANISGEMAAFEAGTDAAFRREIKKKGKQLGDAAKEEIGAGVDEAAQSQSPSRRIKKATENLVGGMEQAIVESKGEIKAATQTAMAEASREKLYGGQQPTSIDKSIRRKKERTSVVGAAADKAAKKNVEAFNKSIQGSVDMFGKLNSRMMGVSSVLGSVSMIFGMFGNDLGGLGTAITGLSSVFFTLAMMSNMLIGSERLKVALTAASVVAQGAFNSGIAKAAATSRMFIQGLLGMKVATQAAAVAEGGVAVAGAGAAVSLWSIVWPIALVVAGLAALYLGIKWLIDWFGDQENKVTGLGDTAAMAAEKVAALGEALGVTVSNIDLSKRVGVASGTTGEQQSMQEKVQTSTYGSEGKSFADYFDSNITAIKDASKGDATASLQSLALQLGNSGFGPETVDGIIRAIADEAGRKDLDLSFASVNLGLDTPEGKAQLSKQVDQAATTLNKIGKENSTTVQNRVDSGYSADGALGTDDKKSVEIAGGQIGTAMQALANGFEQGTIDAETLVSQINSIGDTFDSMDLAGKMLALPKMADAMGLTDSISGIKDVNDQFLVLQATAAGVTINEDQLKVLKQGKAAGDKYTKTIAAITGQIQTAAIATQTQTRAQDALNTSLAVEEMAKSTQGNIDAYNSLINLEGVTLTTAEAIRYASNATIQDAITKVEAAKGTDQYATALANLKGALNSLVTADRQWEKIQNTGGSGKKSAYQEAIDSLKGQRTELLNTAKAYKLLKGANMSAGLSWKYATDPTIAAGLATAGTTKKVKALIAKIKELEALNVKNAWGNWAKENDAQKETLKTQLKMASSLSSMGASAEEMDALLSDEYLAKGFAAGTVSAEQLKAAIDRIRANAQIELEIKMQTPEGMQEVFDDAMSMVQEAFDAKQTQIELDFKLGTNLSGENGGLINTNEIDKIIEDAQNEIDKKSFELDDLDAGLQQIAWQEEDINKKYDLRTKALDKIQKANDAITRQNKSQLTIADALSQGDIAAAARAVEDARAQNAEDAMTSQTDALNAAKEQELAALTDAQGRTRAQLEASIKTLKQEIFDIEEKTLEPATEARRQADLKMQTAISSITVLGQNRDQWDAIQNKVDIARTNSEKYAKAIKDGALDMVQKLVDKWGGLDGKVVTTTHKIIEVTEKAGSGGSGGSGDSGGKTDSAASVTTPKVGDKKYLGSMLVTYTKQLVKGTGVYNGSTFTPPQYEYIWKSGGGIVPQYFGGGGEPRGTDTVPAMLTPGEFVMKKSAVGKYGIGMMRAMNSGTFMPSMSAPAIKGPSGSTSGPSVVGGSASAVSSNSAVYNYSVNVNVNSSNAGAQEVANAVMGKIRSIDSQRVRGVRI